LFLGIGGGTADFVIPKLGHMSMIQAARRMLYRSLAMEQPDGAQVRELILVSMVKWRQQSRQSVARMVE